MPKYLGLSGVGWKLMVKSWWDKLVAGFLLASIVLGSLYILFRVCSKVRSYWQRRSEQVGIPVRILRHLERHRSHLNLPSRPKTPTKDPKSFGVYLGRFDNPPTIYQERLLSQWDVLVLDPMQRGALAAISTRQTASTHTLGRLDLRRLAISEPSSDSHEVIRVIDVVIQTLRTWFGDQQDAGMAFTGVLLADCQAYFQPAVLNEVARYINDFGLDFWLEIAPPAYLTERQYRGINMELIRGIVCRNGTIRPDGDRQNYFQMAEMRNTMRGVAAQRVRHGPPFLMWEEIDNGVEMDYAVVQRSFKWCRYNSALLWVGSTAALTDAEAAALQTVADKPLGALTWLQDDNIMKAHGVWRENNKVAVTSCRHDELYDSLQDFVPDLSAKLRLLPSSRRGQLESRALSVANHLSQYTQGGENASPDPLSISAGGNDFTGLGCFHLGLEVGPEEFEDLRQAQRNLKNLSLLQCITLTERSGLAGRIKILQDAQASSKLTPRARSAVEELLNLLLSKNDDGGFSLQVYAGLHSGFQTSSEIQFWGLYDADLSSGETSIYLSGKTSDRAGVLLHTFLSSRGCTRTECFMAEFAMSDQNGSLSETWHLTPRMVEDIEQLSPIETILFLRRLVLLGNQDDSFLLARLRAICDYQLLELPTLTQLRALSSVSYLSGDITPAELVTSRINWLRERGCRHPGISAAIEVFVEIDTRVQEVLMTGQSELLAQLGRVVRAITQHDQIDAGADIFALSVFCAFRKLALDEIYLEVLDRNCYPNHATDQAGCFAENFGLGSRCDAFFDMTPRALGRIISTRYRAYYMKHQPPARENVFTELPTTYAAMQIDLDPNEDEAKAPLYYQITFLGIFALPALIDIGLLTTIGRGLYLTTFMTDTHKTMATTALMLALLTTGAVGSWISSGGSYYLYANAFPAMNMFILTRFTAGVAIILLGGLGGMAVLMVERGPTAGLVFFYYFAMLSSYLLTLAALAIYQVPGSGFLSGRTAVMRCIPILFISPIVTLWVGYDIVVYVCVLTLFVTALLLSARKIMSEWATWYLNIPCVMDAEVVDWYIRTKTSGNLSPEEKKNIGIGAQPRIALHAAVLKDYNRHFWTKSTQDPFVKRLSDGYASTMFLMSWYCKFKRSRMPLPYTATWNLTLKAGLENMTNMQKGLKLHSAFLHWRHTGADIWSGLLYFVVALLDKWAALLSGSSGALVGLSSAASSEYRLAVGFGLCYYLIGAVSLDAVSQPLWTAANENTVQPITSLEVLRQATFNDTRARRRLYWNSLLKFFFLHLSGVAITSALIWVFEASRSATGMYLAYVGAYTGLLWYQYNKIYCRNEAAKSLTVAAILGLPVGIALHLQLPRFPFSGVIALSFGTWVACFHSIWVAKIGWPSFFTRRPTDHLQSPGTVCVDDESVVYSSNTLEPCAELSQATLAKSFEAIYQLSADQRYPLDPTRHPGARVVELLASRNKQQASDLIQTAFPSADQLLQQSVELWEAGKTVVELVSAQYVADHEAKIRTICRKSKDLLHIFIVLPDDSVEDSRSLDIHRNQKIITEALVQATCEHHLGLSHTHSMLAEFLAVDICPEVEMGIPEGARRQLECSPMECARVVKYGERTLLRYLLLDLDCDKEWDQLPVTIRRHLLKRVCGQSQPLSADEDHWIRSRVRESDPMDSKQFIARCNLGAALTVTLVAVAREIGAGSPHPEQQRTRDPISEVLLPASKQEFGSTFERFSFWFSQVHRIMKLCTKFAVLSLTADPEYQRELDYMLRGKPLFLHWPVTVFLNGFWLFCKELQTLIVPLVLFYGRKNIATLYSNLKGMKTTMEKNRVVIESLSGISTCFLATQADGSFRLSEYDGLHKQEPQDSKNLLAVNTYTSKLVLLQREEYKGESLLNTFAYEYQKAPESSQSKLPVQRQCLEGELEGQIVQYDDRGYITSGSTFRGVNPAKFTYWYRKNAKFEDELLRGEYIFPHITIRVTWSMPSETHPGKLESWIPWSKVTEATFIQGSEVYHASWTYEHKSHPEISTTLNGEPVPTPPMIREDWFNVLTKPRRSGFVRENPLLSFASAKSGYFARFFGFNVRRCQIPTSHARTQLWKTWKASKDLDAVTARYIDERLLRSDSVLNTYWWSRDLGMFGTARKYLDVQADTIMARVDVDPEISSWVHIAFKISDFYSFGQGGDSRINTRTPHTQLRDTEDELHILAMDTSTYPMEPGGVSACRRDMVNDLKTIKWHIVAESANDYGVPRFQIERNIQSLTILPLWGLDFLNPTHGIIQNSLDSAIVQRSFDTRTEDIKKNFLPILISLVRCSRTINLQRRHIEEATSALVDLNTYFESTRNWNDVWNSDIVKQTWRELWLTEDMDDVLPVSQWWDFERPTIFQLDQALNMWHRYLFIFSVPVPEQIPEVFQASHHFTGATYGILCKVKRECTLHVWDHCISFREFTTFMSSAVSFDSPFVNSSLMSLGHLSCVLLEHHADVVLPCAAYFNPGWEVELGTAEGALEHRRTFARKIDPVVNGICNMEKFEPIKQIKTSKPTVVMLSHIQFVKDIKNAIMATDFIVNKWGFTDYTLYIYGDMERAAGHSTECQELIASKGLREHCILGGLANPSVVLQDAWLFLNSSISEGLPLAMGEAALTGVPVVCTDVGASFCVVTDSTTGNRFSEVVPPNDAESLARAQISVLGLLGGWSSFAEDAPGTSPPVLGYPNPSPEQVQMISQRMYDKTEQRRRLGMLGRNNVLKNFSSERYLREHEQMLWIGKYRSRANYHRNRAAASSRGSSISLKEKAWAMRASNPRLTPESWVSLSSVEQKEAVVTVYEQETTSRRGPASRMSRVLERFKSRRLRVKLQ